MAHLRIILEVDTTQLFDTLADVKGNTESIGARIVGLLMTGKAPAADHIGMAFYGITHMHTETVKK